MNKTDNYIEEMAVICRNSCVIEEGLYGKWGVKRGLRDKNGIGVLAGLTHISDVQSYEGRNGRHMPCKGRLIYNLTDRRASCRERV